jgi:hypothetical protein
MDKRSLLLLALLAAACSDGPSSPPVATPVASSVTLSPETAQLGVGDTVRFSATVRDQNGAAMPGAAVSWQVADTTRGSITTTGLFTARAAGNVLVSAGVGTASGAASATIAPPVPMLLESREIVLSSIGSVSQVRATMNGAAVPSLRLSLVDEARWLHDREVVAIQGAAVSALSAGRARLLVSAPGAIPDTVHIRVEPASPVVLAVAATSSPAAAGDSVVLRGYLPGYAGFDVRVDGMPSTVLRADSSRLVIAATEAPLALCGAPARANVVISGVQATVPMTYDRVREGELALDVGEDLDLGPAALACIRTAAAAGAEYLLAYVDDRGLEIARTQDWDFRPFLRKYAATVREVTQGGSPSAAASVVVAAMAHDPGSSHDHSATTLGALNSPGLRDRPWTLDERFLIEPLDLRLPRAVEAQVVSIYGGHFVVAVHVDDLAFWADSIRPAFEEAMGFMLDVGVGMFRRVLIDELPVTGRSGQELLFMYRGAGVYMARDFTNYGVNKVLSAGEWLRFLSHELAHRWHSTWRQHQVETTGQPGGRSMWNVEGLADFLSYDLLRRWADKPFLGNVRPLVFGNDPAIHWVQHQFGRAGSLAAGYQHGASFMRDLAQRLQTEHGMTHDDAYSVVARGAANGWYGCSSMNRCSPVGLVQLMEPLHGGTWDPAAAILTWALSQPADGRTSNPKYQNLTWDFTQHSSPYFLVPPAGFLGSGSGDVVTAETGEYGGGYFVLTDDGRGGAFSASLDVPGGRWRILRVQ